MSFNSAAFPSDPYSKNWTAEGEGGFVRQLHRAGEFLRGLRVQMRFGELSRAPIRLIRLQMIDEVAECDWLARAPDVWDADLSRNVQQRHTSLQALRDAIDVRALLFELMPQVEMGYLRAYRESPGFEREMIIAGCVHRNDHTARNIHSLVMRAKVLGLHFDIDGDTLREISTKEPARAGDAFEFRSV